MSPLGSFRGEWVDLGRPGEFHTRTWSCHAPLTRTGCRMWVTICMIRHLTLTRMGWEDLRQRRTLLQPPPCWCVHIHAIFVRIRLNTYEKSMNTYENGRIRTNKFENTLICAGFGRITGIGDWGSLWTALCQDFIGGQIIHSTPFKSRHSAPRMVRSSGNSNVYVHIHTIFVHIRTDIFVHNISVDIRTYSYIFVHIQTYFVTWIYLACDKQLVPAHTLTNHNGRTLCSSFRRPSIILVDAPNSRHLWISAGTGGWR